jgi:hypothetical protein
MRDEQIERTFQQAWEEFGDDTSTEFLIAITADRCGVDYGRVVDALANTCDAEHLEYGRSEDE